VSEQPARGPTQPRTGRPDRLPPPAPAPPDGITAGESRLNNPNRTAGVCYGESGSPQWSSGSRRPTGGPTSTVRRRGRRLRRIPAIYTDMTSYRNWIYTVMRTEGLLPRTDGGPLDRSGAHRARALAKWRGLIQ